MKRQALFAEILFVDVIIDVEPTPDGYLVGLFVELWVMVDEAAKKQKHKTCSHVFPAFSLQVDCWFYVFAIVCQQIASLTSDSRRNTG